MREPEDETARANDQNVRDAERVVISRAVEFVQACAYCEFAIAEYGEGESELHLRHVKQVEEALCTAVADLLAAEAAA